MLDLTPREQKLLEHAGQSRIPIWVIWLGAAFGITGALSQVVSALLEKPSPDMQAVAFGIALAGFFLMALGTLTRIAALQSLLAKLRDRLRQSKEPA